MAEPNKPCFIKNEATGEDLFAGKSQEKIADILSETIKDQKQNFRVLGIEGGWGSGKSNVVKILEKKLQDYSFFIYDVWGHQEDEQRKAILVELTEKLSIDSKIKLDKDKWQDKLNALLAKRKLTTTTNMPYLSIGFIVSLFTLIYVPLVNTFKANGALGLNTFLVFLPILVLLIIYLRFLYNLHTKKGNDALEEKKSNNYITALQQTFQIYTNKQLNETKIENISESEPSVKEFRDWMKEIDKDLGRQKLIIVLDNFDRLPKKHIASIWSSIHIFFAEETYKNIKIIIPFDRLHLKNAFNDMDGKGNDAGSFANDYVNKTFDLIYRVSPPILSDWKRFFSTKWLEAFPGCSHTEVTDSTQIYETYRSTTTPREIIVFINQVVALRLLDSSIPLRYIALYVIHQEQILENPLTAVTKPEFLGGLSYLYEHDENLPKYLTALAYQISPDNALEVAYRNRLKNSLVNNDQEVLNEIAKLPIFESILLSVISDIPNAGNSILAIDGLSTEIELTDGFNERIWQDLYYRFRNEAYQEFGIGESSLILLKHLPVNDRNIFGLKLVADLRNHQDFNSAKFITIINNLNNYIIEHSLELELDAYEMCGSCSTITLEPKVFLTNVLEATGEKYYTYNLGCNENTLDDYLAQSNNDVWTELNNLNFLKRDFKLPKFIKELYLRIEQEKSSISNLPLFYGKLKQLAERPFTNLLSDSDIYSHFAGIDNTNDFYYDLIAMRMARGYQFPPSYNAQFQAIYQNNDDDLAQKIVSRIEYYTTFEKVLTGNIDDANNPLVNSVIISLVKKRHGQSTATIENILGRYDEIISAYSLDGKDLLQRLNGWKVSNISTENVKEYSRQLYADAKKTDNRLTQAILDAAKSYLNGLDAKAWADAFTDFNSRQYQLIEDIEFNSLNSLATQGLEDAFLEKLANNSLNSYPEWISLFTSFEKAEQNVTGIYKNARDLMFKDASLTDANLMLFLGKRLIENNLLSENGNSTFRTIIKPEFLDEQPIVDLLIGHVDAIKKIMAIANKDDVNGFKRAILDRTNDEEVKALATALGIELPKHRKKVNENGETLEG